jgi:hypothetical protein
LWDSGPYERVAAAGGLMRCNFYDNLSVKGKSEPVPAWRLQGIRRKNRNSNPDMQSMIDLKSLDRDLTSGTSTMNINVSTMYNAMDGGYAMDGGGFGSDDESSYLDHLEVGRCRFSAVLR